MTGKVFEEVARGSAESCGAGSAFDLHLFEEDASGCGSAGAKISRADSDSCGRDEEGAGGQRETEWNVAGAGSGEDWTTGARRGGGALHFCGRGGSGTAGRSACRVRTQSVEEPDARHPRVARAGDACGGARYQAGG